MAEAEVAHLLRVGRVALAHLVALRPGDGEAALAGLEDAAEHAEQLGLAVAGDPGDADHFPARTSKLTDLTRSTPASST